MLFLGQWNEEISSFSVPTVNYVSRHSSSRHAPVLSPVRTHPRIPLTVSPFESSNAVGLSVIRSFWGINYVMPIPRWWEVNGGHRLFMGFLFCSFYFLQHVHSDRDYFVRSRAHRAHNSIASNGSLSSRSRALLLYYFQCRAFNYAVGEGYSTRHITRASDGAAIYLLAVVVNVCVE